MAPPSTDNPKQTHYQQQLQEHSIWNDNNNELPTEARVPDATNDSELCVIESDSLNLNVVNEIQTLAANVAADSAGSLSVDDVLILHYEHNNNNSPLQNMGNNNSNSIDNHLIRFNGILIRNKNKNNSLQGCSNRFAREQMAPYFPINEPSSNTPRPSNFDQSISTINANSVLMCDNEWPVEIDNDINEVEADDDDGESIVEERIDHHGIAYNFNGDATEHLSIDLTTQNGMDSLEEANEMVESQNLEFNRIDRNRPSRRGWGRRRRQRNRRHRYRRNRINRTLKKMSYILRKTTLTLGRIESLILQHLGSRSGPTMLL